tara:strand:+ start:1653 stop:2213 length:561 start_codon:yes stop_codon:yes gene_type:complete
MGLLSDLITYLSVANQLPSAQLQQVAKGTELVNDIIGPWIMDGGVIGTHPSNAGLISPLLFNPAGLPIVITGMGMPPAPIIPTPGQIMIQNGIMLLFTAMPFPPGAPYLPPPVTVNVVPGISAAPVIPFIIPPAPPGVPPPGVAALWVTNLMASAASVMVSGSDLIPGTPPVPAPWVLPFIPAPPT